MGIAHVKKSSRLGGNNDVYGHPYCCVQVAETAAWRAGRGRVGAVATAATTMLATTNMDPQQDYAFYSVRGSANPTAESMGATLD